MRLVIARRSGRRGEGLGNELLPWAKGWIASQTLHARLIGPSWGLNWRHYHRNFGTSRLDFLAEDMFAHLPHDSFTSHDYYASGEIDFGKAIAKWAGETGLDRRRRFIVTVDGMYGGYAAVRTARPFLWSQLFSSRDALANVYRVLASLDRNRLFVAVHMRLGHGFVSHDAGTSLRGEVNVRIPLDWYVSACEAVQRAMDGRVDFRFFTDRPGPDVDEVIRRFGGSHLPGKGLTECSDLLLLAMADLRICSVSSYSLAAAFLADGPYLWYEPQLAFDGSFYSLWGTEEMQQAPGSPTLASVAELGSTSPGSPRESSFKGYAFRAGSGLSPGLAEQLQRRMWANRRSSNLLEYGCLPGWTVDSTAGSAPEREAPACAASSHAGQPAE
jgi:hypothetical protein